MKSKHPNTTTITNDDNAHPSVNIGEYLFIVFN